MTMEKLFDPRMHSAEHILSGAMIKMFSTGRPFTTHLEKKKSKVDYRFDRSLLPGEEEAIERAVNETIARDLPVTEEFLPREEALRSFDLGRLPEESGETIRVVRIGDFDACPCSGPHVHSTKEIGAFRLVSTSQENGALRIRFKLETK
jgi:misacylated tRNA(Ala) deacylase